MKKKLLLLSLLLSFTSYSQKQAGEAGNPMGLPPPPPPFVPSVKLDISTASGLTRLLTLGFLPAGEDFEQWGTDVKNGQILTTDAFFLFGSEQFTSKGLTYSGFEDIPLCVISASPSLFTFSLHEMPDFNEISDVYLYDSRDKSYHDLKKGSYDALILAGSYPDRFKVRFVQRPPADNNGTGILVYQDNAIQAIKVLNPHREPIKTFTLYDLNGRAVHMESSLPSAEDITFSTAGINPGIYFAVLTGADYSVIIHKVLLSNFIM